jgi:hypothetical protein
MIAISIVESRPRLLTNHTPQSPVAADRVDGTKEGMQMRLATTAA